MGNTEFKEKCSQQFNETNRVKLSKDINSQVQPDEGLL